MKPENATDFYKTGHRSMYPAGTEFVYSNFTCRSDKLAKGSVLEDFDHKTVFFGLQGMIRWLLIEMWNKDFFHKDRGTVVERYNRRMDSSLGPNVVPTEHIEALHKLGHLPIRIKALPEGSRVDIRVPLFTIMNTHKDFFWLTNYLETQISAEIWKPITVATIAYEYRRLLEKFAEKTGAPKEFVGWQGHDFSFRGMSGIHDAMHCGAAHLLSFTGTDTISAIDYLEEHYGASGLVGGSVPATEHSVMCMGGKGDEIGTFNRLISNTYPSGIVSIVSDTWDFWQVICEFTQKLKSEILARNGKVVFRPDSGDPVKIICGSAYPVEDLDYFTLDDVPYDYEYVRTPDNKFYALNKEWSWDHKTFDPQEIDPTGKPELLGAVECLWDVFGGTTTDKGYKQLDSHVGLIYGDSITIKRAQAILEGLEKKGFASSNIVFGIGSFTYQHVTRDTFGSAIKATFGVVNGKELELFKQPKTDDGTKNSAKGLIRVMYDEEGTNRFVYYDQQTWEQESGGMLETVFENGEMKKFYTLQDIRNRLLGA